MYISETIRESKGMNALEKKIIQRIVKEGPITFETFMEMVLRPYPED